MGSLHARELVTLAAHAAISRVMSKHAHAIVIVIIHEKYYYLLPLPYSANTNQETVKQNNSYILGESHGCRKKKD